MINLRLKLLKLSRVRFLKLMLTTSCILTPMKNLCNRPLWYAKAALDSSLQPSRDRVDSDSNQSLLSKDRVELPSSSQLPLP